MSVTQISPPPLSSGLPVLADQAAHFGKPWGNWLTIVWQQLAALFTLTGTISTTNATITTIATIVIPPETTMLIQARIVARRTGGSSGTAEDGAAYVICAAYKNVAGVATEIGESSLFSAEDQVGWAATVTPSGANALIQVTGAANNNVDWSCLYQTTAVN